MNILRMILFSVFCITVHVSCYGMDLVPYGVQNSPLLIDPMITEISLLDMPTQRNIRATCHFFRDTLIKNEIDSRPKVKAFISGKLGIHLMCLDGYDHNSFISIWDKNYTFINDIFKFIDMTERKACDKQLKKRCVLESCLSPDQCGLDAFNGWFLKNVLFHAIDTKDNRRVVELMEANPYGFSHREEIIKTISDFIFIDDNSKKKYTQLCDYCLKNKI